MKFWGGDNAAFVGVDGQGGVVDHEHVRLAQLHVDYSLLQVQDMGGVEVLQAVDATLGACRDDEVAEACLHANHAVTEIELLGVVCEHVVHEHLVRLLEHRLVPLPLHPTLKHLSHHHPAICPHASQLRAV